MDGVGRKVDQRVCFDVMVDQCGADYLSVRDEETWEWQSMYVIYVSSGSCVCVCVRACVLCVFLSVTATSSC